MGKKRITTETGQDNIKQSAGGRPAGPAKRKLHEGVVHIEATYNNTKLLLADSAGNAVFSSSSGALGFRGAKKGTPFAAGKVAELLAERFEPLGLKEIEIVIKGVGAGREAAVRALAGKGLVIKRITDATPVPFNGPKPKKPRRV